MAVCCTLASCFVGRLRRVVPALISLLRMALAVLLCAFSAQAKASAWITTAAAVHNQSRADAARHRSVHLIATVTYYDPVRHLLFVEDKSGGVYIDTSKPYPLHPGDLIDVVGTTEPSFHGNVAVDPTIRLIGQSVLPKPIVPEPGETAQLIGGRWNSQRATLHGVVRSALIDPFLPDRLDLELLMDGNVMQASVLHAGNIDPTELFDSEVAITGTVGANYNAKWQFICLSIYSNQGSDLKVLRRAAADPGSLPLTSVDEVMKSQSIIDETRRVRMRGAITYYHPGRTIVIEQDGRSISATTWQRTPAPLGSMVDLTGFAYQGEFGPVLRQVTFELTGSKEPVRPTPVTYNQAMKGTFNDELISVRGRLVSQNHGETSDTLTLLVDHHPITVDLQEPVDGKWLPSLRPGSEVEVAGICRVTLTTSWDRPRSLPAFFRVDLRSAGDLRVLSLPSWWTMDHLLKVLLLVCVLAAALSLWALALRRRVSQQTAKLEGSMRLEQERSRMLQAISSDKPLRFLLDDLCATCEEFLPQVRCGCEVIAEEHLCMKPFQTGTVFPPSHELPVYEARLDDGRGGLLGHFRASPQQPRPLTSGEREVFDVFAGLATLTVNQRRMYQELNYTSTHDQLTGLPNRRLADTCLERALQQRSRNGFMVAVVYIDVDHFKEVNDQYGHKTGDQYLQMIASRMRGAVRSSDTLARVGGDEFLLIAAGVREPEEADRYRGRLATCFAEPFVLDNAVINGAASIGIAVSPEHGTSAEELNRRADMDMYAAKHLHRIEPRLQKVALTA